MTRLLQLPYEGCYLCRSKVRYRSLGVLILRQPMKFDLQQLCPRRPDVNFYLLAERYDRLISGMRVPYLYCPLPDKVQLRRYKSLTDGSAQRT